VLVALLVLGGVLVALTLRSVGWSPGASTVHVVGHAMDPSVSDGDYVLVQPYRARAI
jgi:signal peptidase I